MGGVKEPDGRGAGERRPTGSHHEGPHHEGPRHEGPCHGSPDHGEPDHGEPDHGEPDHGELPPHPGESPGGSIPAPRRPARGDDGFFSGVGAGLEVVYGILFTPRASMEQLAERPPLVLAFAVFLLVNLFTNAVSLSTLKATPLGSFIGEFYALILVTSVAISLAYWFVISAVYDLLAELAGGRGRGPALFGLVGLAQVPRIFGPPLLLLGKAAGSQGGVFFSLALSIWVLVLYGLAITRVHRIPASRAAWVIVAPWLVLVGFAAVLVALATLAAARLPVEEFPSIFGG